MKKKYHVVYLAIIVLLLIGYFLNPYDYYKKWNANQIKQDIQLQQQIPIETATSIKYQGNDIYVIQIQETTFIAMQEYISVMNYKWNIFEIKTDGE